MPDKKRKPTLKELMAIQGEVKPGEKRKPTLREIMIKQGKIKPDNNTAKKPAPKKTQDLKEQIMKMQNPEPELKPKDKAQQAREDRIKALVEKHPDQAAELLRRVFLDGKQDK